MTSRYWQRRIFQKTRKGKVRLQLQKRYLSSKNFVSANIPKATENLDLKGENVFVYSDEFLLQLNMRKALRGVKKSFLSISQDKSHSQEKKCQLLRNRVAFLEHVLGQEGVTTDPDRIDKVG